MNFGRGFSFLLIANCLKLLSARCANCQTRPCWRHYCILAPPNCGRLKRTNINGTDVPFEEPLTRVLDWEASSFSVIAIQANNTLGRPFDQRTSVVFSSKEAAPRRRGRAPTRALTGVTGVLPPRFVSKRLPTHEAAALIPTREDFLALA